MKHRKEVIHLITHHSSPIHLNQPLNLSTHQPTSNLHQTDVLITKFFNYSMSGGINMILTNIESVPGMNIISQFGLVSGSTVRAKNAIKDFGAGLKNMVGGELKSYTELLIEARKEATERMKAQAQRMGANAVVNVRFATSAVTVGAAEVYIYGTAVKVVPVEE